MKEFLFLCTCQIIATIYKNNIQNKMFVLWKRLSAQTPVCCSVPLKPTDGSIGSIEPQGSSAFDS